MEFPTTERRLSFIETRICWCSTGNFLKEIIRLQIAGCAFRILMWITVIVGAGHGVFSINHDHRWLMNGIEHGESEAARVKVICGIAIIVAVCLIVIYGGGIVLSFQFLGDERNKRRDPTHLRSWKIYSVVTLIIGVLVDSLLLLSSHCFSLIPMVSTILLNVYTFKAVRLQQSNSEWNDIVSLSAPLAEH